MCKMPLQEFRQEEAILISNLTSNYIRSFFLSLPLWSAKKYFVIKRKELKEDKKM